MYRATTSFTTNDYDVRYRQILEDDFASQEEIDEFLRIGYIEAYDDTIDITENGIYDVEDYQNADVNVPSGEPILQSKDITINQNGTTTVTADQGYDGLSDVDVTVSGILDTSDATANPTEIANNKTAYVNGQKITGTVDSYTSSYVASNGGTSATETPLGLNIESKFNSRAYFNEDAKLYTNIAKDKVTTAIGLTADKLKKDVTILGVTGTYEGGDYFVSSLSGGTYSNPGTYRLLKAVPEITFVNDGRYGLAYNSNLISVGKINFSNVQSANGFFTNCSSLTNINEIDLTGVTDMQNFFSGCSSLVTAPNLITPNIQSIQNAFGNCISLVNVPVYDFSLVTSATANAFYNCPNLSNDSLNNILQMCIDMTSYTGTKTLKVLGLTSTQATTCQTLSNWDAFVAAGWSTGY